MKPFTPITDVLTKYGMSFVTDSEASSFENALSTNFIFNVVSQDKNSFSSEKEFYQFIRDNAAFSAFKIFSGKIVDLQLWKNAFQVDNALVRFPAAYLLGFTFHFWGPSSEPTKMVCTNWGVTELAEIRGVEGKDVMSELSQGYAIQKIFNSNDAHLNFSRELKTMHFDLEDSLNSNCLEKFKEEIFLGFIALVEYRLSESRKDVLNNSGLQKQIAQGKEV